MDYELTPYNVFEIQISKFCCVAIAWLKKRRKSVGDSVLQVIWHRL